MSQPEKNQPPPRHRSIATRSGDAGQTSLLFGKRVSKADPQLEACGALDELSAALALARATAPDHRASGQLQAIQSDLIAIMGEVATPPEAIERYAKSSFQQLDESHLARIDRELAKIEKALPPLKGWALPGVNLHEAALEGARAAVRRAERRLVALKEAGFPARPLLLQYLNRASDLLWVLARAAAQRHDS